MTEKDNKWAENQPDPELNVSSLDEIFDALPPEKVLTPEETQLKEIENMRKELDRLRAEQTDPDDIIYDNIARANRLLDSVEDSMERGNINNRLLEVAGQLITAVTAAAVSISGMGHNALMLEQKTRDLDRKEKELELKKTIKTVGNDPDNPNNIIGTQNNLIFTDRESLMDIIKKTNQEDIEEAQLVPVKNCKSN